jgi:hypothetical protein
MGMPTKSALRRRALGAPLLPAVALAVALSVAPARAAKDTPLGAELIGANYPNTSADDLLRALIVTSAIGGHSSHIWYFSNQPALADVAPIVSLMRWFGLKVLLQIGPTFLDSPSPPDGFAKSFADPAVRSLYLANVAAIASTHPDYLVLATEINLLYRFNPEQFEHFRSLYREAYDVVKSVSPGTRVGASYLYTLWYVNYVDEHVDVPALVAPADFIAFTTYPEDIVFAKVYPSIAEIPPAWYGAAREAYPTASIGFSEVGWSSKLRGTPELQAEFVRNLPRLMSTTGPEFVTWAVLHDVEFFQRSLLTPEYVAFLESLGVDIDVLFAHFNGMGLLDGYGDAKPALFEAANLVFPPP